MLIAWTTVGTGADAKKLATAAIAAGLAVCVQIEGPIESHYRWKGRTEKAAEFRLTFKLVPARQAALEALIRELHPYETPEWIVVQAKHVSEKYLSWAESNSSPSPL